MSDLVKNVRTIITAAQKNRSCLICGSNRVYPDDFTDDLSRREYQISGLCQACQDIAFSDDEEV